MALNLAKWGAKRITKGNIPRNLLIDVRAETKCGTTRLCLKNTPRKNGIVFCNFDRPLEEVRGLEKFIAGADLQEVPCQDWSRKDQDSSIEVVKRLEGVCADAVKQRASLVVIDKATDLNECYKMALYGKIDQIVKRDYGKLNARWSNLLQPFKNSETSLILVHRLGEVYKNDKPTGISKSKGWGDVAYHCTVSVEMGKDYKEEGVDKFWLEVTDCTYDTRVEGEELRGKSISFTKLAMMIYPESDSADWE